MGRFGEYGQAVVGAGGTATVYVRGPNRTGYVWNIGQVIVNCTPAAGNVSPTATVYRSAAIPSLIMGESINAAGDTLVGHPGDTLTPGDQLVVLFAGCQPGTLAQVTMTGNEAEGP